MPEVIHFCQPSARLRPLIAALALTLLTVASCGGPQIIRGRPPFVGIAGMQTSGDALNTDFRVSNENGVVMTIQSIDLAITVDRGTLVSDQRTLQLVIDANGAEELAVHSVLDSGMRDRLLALEQGSVSSLAFQLGGSVRTLEDGVLRFEQKGHLYPVPGKPGHFRSAVTQAQDLKREEPY
jgi:hypothetical protein